jgi:hypothetical protein
MENLTNDDKLLYKKLMRNKKAREAYYKASEEGRNKKLVNISGPSRRGRKPREQTNISIIEEPKEPTETEKLFQSVRQQNRKQQYNKNLKQK